MITTAEIIVRLKAHLSTIEEMSCKGMRDPDVLMEIARFAGAANLLRWESETEYDLVQKARETRERMARDAAAEGAK